MKLSPARPRNGGCSDDQPDQPPQADDRPLRPADDADRALRARTRQGLQGRQATEGNSQGSQQAVLHERCAVGVRARPALRRGHRHPRGLDPDAPRLVRKRRGRSDRSDVALSRESRVPRRRDLACNPAARTAQEQGLWRAERLDRLRAHRPDRGTERRKTMIANISPRRIADLFVTAIEGGSNYWCRGIYLESPGDVAPDDPHRGPWYDNPRRYADPDLRLKVVELSDEYSGATTDHFIGLAEINDGLTKLAASKDYAHHFADIVTENEDATTADIFLQFVVFGQE